MKLVISAEVILSEFWLNNVCEIFNNLLSMINLENRELVNKNFSALNNSPTDISFRINNDNDFRFIFNETKTKLTISIGNSGTVTFDEPETILLFHKALTHKIIFIPLFIAIAFSDFITSNANTLIHNNIDSCVLLWPKSYSDIISSKLSVSPKWTNKFIKRFVMDAFNSNSNPNDTTKLSLFFTLQYLLPSITKNDQDTSVLIDILNFLTSRLSSFISQLKLTETDVEALSNIKYSVYNINANNSYDNILKEPFCFFLEDTSSYLDKILLENKKVIGLSVDSNETYTWDRIYIWDRLLKILPPDNDNKPLLNNYRINFIESLDKKLYASISKLLNEETLNNYLYIVCEDDFVKRKIVNYIDNSFSSNYDINHLYCTSSDRPKITNHKLIFVHEFAELNKKEQYNTWEYLFNDSYKNIKVIFFDKTSFSNTRIDLESRKVWYYKEEMLENNLSKIFHSILDDKNNVKVNEEIIEAINNNNFIDLIKTDYFEYDLKLLAETISMMHLSGFDYRTVSSWYNYRQLYDNESMKQYDSKAESAKMLQTKKIIFRKNDSKNLEIFIDGKPYTEKYRKTTMYLMLAIDYWQEKGKYIGAVHLNEIIDYYFDQNEIADKLETGNTDKSASSSINSALFKKGAKNLHNKTKKFINEHIKIKLGKIEYYDKDLENEQCKYIAEFDGVKFDKRLYDNNYRDLLNHITNKIGRNY